MKALKSVVATLILFAAMPLAAQYVPTPAEEPSPDGALTPEVLESLRQSLVITPQLKAVQNALA